MEEGSCEMNEGKRSVRGGGNRTNYESVTPSYSRISEHLRRISAGSLQCSMFCGGRRCKYETETRWDGQDKALRGLFSHWVTDDIIATARPSSLLFEKYRLIDQFKSAGIGTVINLQLPGEHARCGPGLESSGFTYHPEELMRHGVYFYNYGWMDYGVPTVESVLDMVKVLDFALEERKVAVHCHAGLGRTGVLIACYLVFSRRLMGDEAIAHVRAKRPGSIQTRPQIEIVQQFALSLSPLWLVYPSPSLSLSLEGYLSNQRLLLHGTEQRKLRHIPKVIYEVCSRLEALHAHDQSCDRKTQNSGDNALLKSWLPDHEGRWREGVRERVEAMQSEMNSSRQWPLLSQETDPRVLCALVLRYFAGLKEPLLSSSDVALLKGNHSLDTLSAAKRSTVKCFLDTLRKVLPGDVNDQAPLLRSRLACSLLQVSQEHCGKSSESMTFDPGAQNDCTTCVDLSSVTSFILAYWKMLPQ